MAMAMNPCAAVGESSRRSMIRKPSVCCCAVWQVATRKP
jgi:hypothetical protein